MHYLIAFIGNTIALFLTVYLVPGITVANFTALIVASVIVALVNTFIRPILRLISLPVTMVTFGLFALVVNAAAFGLAAWLSPGLEIEGIIPAFIGALVLSIVSTAIGFFTDRMGRKSSKNESPSQPQQPQE